MKLTLHIPGLHDPEEVELRPWLISLAVVLAVIIVFAAVSGYVPGVPGVDQWMWHDPNLGP